MAQLPARRSGKRPALAASGRLRGDQRPARQAAYEERQRADREPARSGDAADERHSDRPATLPRRVVDGRSHARAGGRHGCRRPVTTPGVANPSETPARSIGPSMAPYGASEPATASNPKPMPVPARPRAAGHRAPIRSITRPTNGGSTASGSASGTMRSPVASDERP